MRVVSMDWFYILYVNGPLCSVTALRTKCPCIRSIFCMHISHRSCFKNGGKLHDATLTSLKLFLQHVFGVANILRRLDILRRIAKIEACVWSVWISSILLIHRSSASRNCLTNHLFMRSFVFCVRTYHVSCFSDGGQLQLASLILVAKYFNRINLRHLLTKSFGLFVLSCERGNIHLIGAVWF